MKVKICGQTRAEDIRFSFDSGADLCGVVVEVASSPRSMALASAVPLFEEFPGRVVALTANAPDTLYAEIAERLKPYAIQLTAGEPPEEAAEVIARYGVRIFKSLHLPQVSSGEEPEDFVARMDEYIKAGVRTFVLDTLVKDMFGGSGKRSDWTLAGKVLARARAETFLAGGISPENVREAAALHPAGIDLASGVETAPGVKSREKIRDLFEKLGKVHK